MMMILVPANVATMLALLIPVVQFDLIPPKYSYELFLSFEEEPPEKFLKKFESRVSDQMHDLGY
jgi:hypothetical protein